MFCCIAISDQMNTEHALDKMLLSSDFGLFSDQFSAKFTHFLSHPHCGHPSPILVSLHAVPLEIFTLAGVGLTVYDCTEG